MKAKIKYNKDKPLNICLVSFPLPSALVTNVFLTSIIDILEPLCKSLYVITANINKEGLPLKKTKIIDVKTSMHSQDSVHPRWWSVILQLCKIFVIQWKICWALVTVSRDIDVIMFYLGGANLLPAVLTAKILRKKIMMFALGLGSASYQRASIKGLSGIYTKAYSAILNMLERTNFFLANKIIIESRSCVNFLGLSRYKQKLEIVALARYINTEIFKVVKGVKARENLIGYIGRLHFTKGVNNFVDAMPIISKECKDASFLIAGNGSSYNQIKQQIDNYGMSHRLRLTGWVSHNELPRYLNELILLVLPSYSEGLPTIILEAMACGTPVLATPVGGVPDVIKDEETGFIMEDNSPQCIARNVIRALNHSNLEQIVNNARALINREFVYEIAVERFRQMLSKLSIN